MNKKISVLIPALAFIPAPAYSQDVQQLFSQASNIAASGGSVPGAGFLSGFSGAWLFGSIIFGIIGFAAFGYGKKSTKYKPLLIGIALMIYPYFVRSSLVLYLVGGVLTVLLFYPRD